MPRWKQLNNETVLQERRTLDDVLLTCVRASDSGCHYRLYHQQEDNTFHLERGCSNNLLLSLNREDEILLYRWFTVAGIGTKSRVITGFVRPETILTIRERPQCKVCGGFRVVEKEPHAIEAI